MHSSLEKHLIENCPNCGIEHQKELESQFDFHSSFTHYLSTICECKYEVFFKTEFDSSGHIHF